MRTFLAIDVPSGLQGPLGRELGSLKGALSDLPLRWVPLENMHLTLKFLGKTREDLLPDLTHSVQSCCRSIDPFEISIGGLGAFPSLKRPRVVWIGASGPPGTVRALHGCVESGLAPLGFERDQRKLHLHLTLARVPRSIRPQHSRRLAEHLQSWSVPEIEGFQVEHLTLYRSELSPEGARYSALEKFPLANSSASVVENDRAVNHEDGARQ